MNIKNKETHRLARELAELTGETMTGAVTVAIRERLDREKHERSVDERRRALQEIRQRIAKLPRRPGPSAADHGEFLYDERGLPA